MISIYMIIAMATALAKGSIECSFTEPAGAQLCSGAVGQLLIFHLPNTANTDIWLKKDNEYIIFKKVKNKTVTPHEQFLNQPEVFVNGTIKLGNAMKRHTGDYVLEVYGSDGVLLKTVKMHLELQAPVSKPAVSQKCLSPEQTDISCSSEGDEVEFILTLGGYLLIQTRAQSQSLSSSTQNAQAKARSKTEQDKPTVSNVSISVHGQLTGNVTCRVRNNVSREETVLRLTGCTAFFSHSPVDVAVRAGVIALVLLALCLGICHVHRNIRPKTVNDGISKDDTQP